MRRWTRWTAAVTVVLAAFAALMLLRRERPSAPRDIILITIDTLRADSLGYAGNAGVRTPFLDDLARRGVVYSNAHAHNVVTLPSHANILTGLYPWQHGIRDNAGFELAAEHVTIAQLLKDAGFATGAFVSAYPLDSRFGLDQGFDVYDDAYRASSTALDFAVQERDGTETLTRAQSWWDSKAGEKRFLWVHLYEPHAPYVPPAPYHEEYRENLYLGEVAATDAMLAATLGPMLRNSPQAMVIVTADHGEALGDHGEKTHGLFAYESTLRVPLIVIDPGRPPGSDGRFVGHIDVAPTIFERLGLPVRQTWKGTSLFAEGKRGYTYFEALSASLNRGWAPLIGAIADGKKFIDLPLPELYDLALDPAEKVNRFREDRRAVAALREILTRDAPSKAPERAEVPHEEQERLLSLGYLTGAHAKTTWTEADDPKNLIHLDTILHEAIAAYQAGNLDLAVEKSRSLVSMRADMEIAQEMLAFFLAESRRPSEAIAVLERRVASGRANDSVRIRLGLLLSEAGRAREAIALLAPFATRIDPDILNAYGIALADSGDHQAATRQFMRILEKDPENARAFQNLGIIALRGRDIARARANLERALRLDGDLPLALNALGVVEAMSGNPRAAIAHWSRAVALDPSQIDAHFNLGMTAGEQNIPETARKALREYLARAPEQQRERRNQATAMLRSLG